jgi:hypothetical protein
VRIAVARTCLQRQRQIHVVDAAGEEADVIERGTERGHAGTRDRAETGFEADDAVEGCRPDLRAEPLRAQCQRYDPGRDGGCEAR